MMMIGVRHICMAGLVSSAALFTGTASADSDDLDAIRAATSKFKDVNVALSAGYVPDASGCISAAAEGLPPELGGMGIHYINPVLLGITATEPRVDGNGLNVDFKNPSILLYEPQADGSLALVGVENLVFQKAWGMAGHSGPPEFGARPWDTMEDMAGTKGDEAHGFEPHYDLHVWTERPNPTDDLFAFNASVTCP